MAPALQRRQLEARGEDNDSRQRRRGQLFQQPAQLRVEKPPAPAAQFMLDHLGPVEDQGPALAAQPRQEAIDAEAG